MDTALSSASTNAVQNKVIQAALDKAQYYQAGETVNVSGMYAAGHITNNANRVQFFIPLPRDITKRTVTLNTPWVLSIRGTNGISYLMPSATANSYLYNQLTSDAYGSMVTVLISKHTQRLANEILSLIKTGCCGTMKTLRLVCAG